MDAVEIIRQLEGDPAPRAQMRAALLGDELFEATAMVISQRVPHDSVLGRARELGAVVVAEATGHLVPGG